MESSDGAPVIEQMSVAPALGSALAKESEDAFLGVRTGLIRLLSPSRILGEAIEQLRRQTYWLEKFEQRGGATIPPAQVAALDRVSGAGVPTPKATISDDQLASIAASYVALYRRGIRNATSQLAAQFGLTREQTRDRIHRARNAGYLMPTKQGRAGAEPGPRLRSGFIL